MTAVSLRKPPADGRRTRPVKNALAIGIEHKGENFALMVDEVGDVLSLGEIGANPGSTAFSIRSGRG